MAEAKFPSEMPGEFFVLTHNREMETYLIQCDDVERGSHVVPDDWPTMKLHLCGIWHLEPHLMARAVDQAREWRDSQQVIPAQNRTLRLKPRVPKSSVFEDAPERETWIGHV